jgi:hypothetical protein
MLAFAWGYNSNLMCPSVAKISNAAKSTMHTGGKVGRKAVSDVVQAKRLPHVSMFK